MAFTFVNASWDGKTHCYLKSAIGAKKSIPGAVSAAVTSPRTSSCSTQVGGYCGNKDWSLCCPYGSYCQPWNTGYYQCIKAPRHCSTQLTDVDFYGNDLGVVYGLHPTGCCEKCTQTAGCVGYTFVSDNPGKTACYLKSSIDGKRRSVGVVSGKVDLTGVSHIHAKIRRGEARSRAVSLGAWLVAEYWMSWDSYTLWQDIPVDIATQGEYAAMNFLGEDKGAAAFSGHRQTWVTESDIKEIADTGVLNTVRVPVGYWIARDAVNLPGDEGANFAPGGLKFLDVLINDWALKHNLAVIVSLHAHQGSQNGYAHSAPVTLGAIDWSTSHTNVNNSLAFATFIADRYKDSPAFLGMNLMNEPAPPTDRKVLIHYYIDAYNRIRASRNDCIILVSPLVTEQDPSGFDGMIRAPVYENVWNEIHAYFIRGYEDRSEAWILDHLDVFKEHNLQRHTKGNRLFVGQWSMAGPPDEKGMFQDIGCFHELGRKQLAMFNEEATGGWAFWSWRHSDETFTWSLRTLIRYNDMSFSFELS
ncbi:Glucan 1 [Phytophthora cinnamomi]|nr:Glucan 1 [Phytophthora cinnamomi]